MKRHLLTIFALWLAMLPLPAQTREVHILSANDMHANIGAFPRLAAIADSLRTIYPDLLVLSAGDNRTGEPVNDFYETPAYPMVALMNQVGFDATTLGNHEFDSGAEGLARVTQLAHFSHLCCNVHPDPSLGMHLRPCKTFDVNGVKVGIVGVVQLGKTGIPDTHPDNCRGISFSPVKESVEQCRGLRDECDVVILLSHIGYEDDVQLSKSLPWVDLIVGGHSHTQLDGGEMHNGILITQNVNRLDSVTHITITLDDKRVVDRRAENIALATFSKTNKVVDDMVGSFSDNPEFLRVLAQATTPFSTYDELGCLMCDAFKAETGADFAFTNYGSIRYDTHPAGPFTVSEVLQLDPFGNDAVEMNLTGEELRQMLIACCDANNGDFPVVSAPLRCEVTRDKNDPKKVKNLKLSTDDGKPLNLRNTYRVVTNTYVAAVCLSPHKDPGRNLNRQTSQLIIDFLQHQGTISYQGVKRVFQK